MRFDAIGYGRFRLDLRQRVENDDAVKVLGVGRSVGRFDFNRVGRQDLQYDV